MKTALASSTDTSVLPLPSDQDASGRTLGAEEISLVADAIRSGTLTSTKGKYVKQLEGDFAKMLGSESCHACASGSAAVHVAVAALDLEPGDEVITTPITDMGAITPILFQGAIPVFADVDPRSYNVTAESIAARISERTKAIIVTHLFGNPCEMDPIMEIARSRDIPVIEDCAQAFLSEYKGKMIGTIGDIGCFSLQQGKHVTTGEGGLVVTNDSELSRRCFLFINKAWGYGDAAPDHYFSALNYRMCELQGAVAVAQLAKLKDVVSRRQELASDLTQQLLGLDGVEPPMTTPESTHAYWKYCLHIDGEKHENGSVRLGDFLKEHGIACAPRYIQKPAFRCDVIAKQRTLGASRWPFTLAHPDAVDYNGGRYAGSFEALSNILVLPWNENYTSAHVDFIAETIRKGAAQL